MLWVLIRSASLRQTSTHNVCFHGELRKIFYLDILLSGNMGILMECNMFSRRNKIRFAFKNQTLQSQDMVKHWDGSVKIEFFCPSVHASCHISLYCLSNILIMNFCREIKG